MTAGDDTGDDGGPMTTGINPPDDDGDETSDGSTSTGEPPGDTTSAETGDASETGDSAETGDDPTTGGGTYDCEPETTCNSAGSIGGVSGDTPGAPLTETGTEPVWLQVQVSENDSGVFGNDLSVTLSLQSEGGDWDLRTFLGAPGDTNGCGGEEQRSESAGTDSVSYAWGESGALANNADDGTFVAIEIFPKAGVCTMGASWSLTVNGNT